MKKCILFAVLAISTISCIKESDVKPSPIMPSHKTRAFVNYQYGIDITDADIVSNLQDDEDEELSTAILNLTKAMRPILADNSLSSRLVLATKDAINRELDLRDFATANPSFNDIVNAELATLVPNFGNFNNSWQMYCMKKLVREGVQYKPFVHIGNGSEVDYSQQPLLCAGLTISELTHPAFDDNIPCWYRDGSELKMTTINDELSFTVSQPILIIDNGLGVAQCNLKRQRNRVLDIEGRKIRTTGDKLSQNKFQIDFAFEGNSKIDYTIGSQVTEFWEPGNPHVIVHNAASTATTIKVPKSLVGTICNTPCDIITQSLPSSGLASHKYDPDRNTSGVKQALCTFEYDWYASLKPYDNKFIQNGNSTVYQQRDLRMKFVGEFYHFDPALYDGYIVTLMANGVPVTITSKGFIELVRTK